ncbi:MAG: quinolinate synthase NadA [Tissierellia bacterium]|nr:quinolinate synthase NadA [Tissierellia bacterium]
MSLEERVQQLKLERDAIILAHYYVPAEVQRVADFVGDSYALAKRAMAAPQKVIVFAGVHFMGESAKILNPEKTVLVPELAADCPMAHMVSPEKIEEVRGAYEDLAVVCYINSTAEIKAHSDVIVTSANALKVVRALPEKNIFFVPDENLGRFIAAQLPEKNFILNEGHCHVHAGLSRERLLEEMERHPQAEVLAHPECTAEILELAHYIGSTSGIINYATEAEGEEFIICTEEGVAYELREKNPHKTFHFMDGGPICPDMKLITLEKLLHSLETMEPAMEMDEDKMARAKAPLERMLELAK